jgi:cell division protein FtsB
MDEESTFGGIGILLVIAIIWLAIIVHTQKQQIKVLKEVVSSCDSTVTQANQTINDLNSNIDYAKEKIQSDYISMSDALYELETGDTVNNPCYVPLDK